MDKPEARKIINEHKPYTGMICELIKALLKAEKIKYHVVESRTKELESLEEKIERKDIVDYKKEILDITGIRIILYYQDDLDKVESLIDENFKIDSENSINKETLLKSNEFGYLSRHYIVKLNSQRAKLPEWRIYSKLKAEIQVRTVLQHSWASISHELSYKKKYEIPKELSRKLFRLAGLFELADEQFLVIKNEHEKLKSDINKLDDKEILDEAINILTLKQNFKRSKNIYSKITSIASQNDFTVYNDSESPSDDERYFSGIILISDYLGLSSLKDLNKELTKNSDKYKTLFSSMIEQNENDTWNGPKSFMIMVALLYSLSNEQLERFSKKLEWHNSLWEITVKAINITKNNG